MDIGSVVPHLFIAIVTFGVIFWLARLFMQDRVRAIRNPELEAQCGAAGLEVTASPLGMPEVRGTLHETPFVMTAIPGAHTTPSRTVIRVPMAAGANFAITRDASRDLSGRDLVESTFPELRTREAVRALFGLGFDTIMRWGPELSAIRTFKAEMLHPDALSAAVAQLAVIRVATGVQAAPNWVAPPQSSTRLVVASVVLMVAAARWRTGRPHVLYSWDCRDFSSGAAASRCLPAEAALSAMIMPMGRLVKSLPAVLLSIRSLTVLAESIFTNRGSRGDISPIVRGSGSDPDLQVGYAG